MTATTIETPSPQSAPGPDEAVAAYSHRQIMTIMSGLMLGMLLAVLDQTIISTALTRISEDFHRPDLYSWVVTSYLLTSTASTPLYGKLGDLYGRKKIFQIAIVIFLLGSALAGLSQSMIQLIIFRGVQGLGAGGLISLALAIVGDVISPRERGRYQGYFGAMFAASSILGPLIGGFLVDQASWRWVFYVNIPVGIVALIVIRRVLTIDYARRTARLDIFGALLLVGGVSLFLIAVQDAGQQARITQTIFIVAIAGLALIVGFAGWEKRAAEPILPPRLFGNAVFRVTSTLSLITGAIMFGAIIFMPQYLQLVRGSSPTLSGLRLLPLLAGMLITSVGSGRLVTKLGRYKIFIIAGTGVMTAGMALLTLIRVGTNGWLLSAMLFVVGFGLGLFIQNTVLATQNSVDIADLGTATSAVTFLRTLGGAVGASSLGAIIIAYQRSHVAGDIERYGPHAGPLVTFTHGMDHAYLWTVPIGLAAFVLSFFMRELNLRTTAATSARTATAEPAA
ncbi:MULTISPECIES: MDR family MFS transporter [unclassified Frankia]|uniref:MDR family MFS transporter n=1 Tax=unclassified Frankia TaxID=2632575 RepID=UPI001EF47CDA|nr:MULTISPECIES: MDR family MFS transporter [unclassified Frankia]